jgi:hypothetical protein
MLNKRILELKSEIRVITEILLMIFNNIILQLSPFEELSSTLVVIIDDVSDLGP